MCLCICMQHPSQRKYTWFLLQKSVLYRSSEDYIGRTFHFFKFVFFHTRCWLGAEVCEMYCRLCVWRFVSYRVLFHKVEKYGFVCSFRQLNVFHGCEGTRYNKTLDHFDSLSQSNSMSFDCNPPPIACFFKGKKKVCRPPAHPSQRMDFPVPTTTGWVDWPGGPSCGNLL